MCLRSGVGSTRGAVRREGVGIYLVEMSAAGGWHAASMPVRRSAMKAIVAFVPSERSRSVGAVRRRKKLVVEKARLCLALSRMRDGGSAGSDA